jgi:hypothetical protein
MAVVVPMNHTKWPTILPATVVKVLGTKGARLHDVLHHIQLQLPACLPVLPWQLPSLTLTELLMASLLCVIQQLPCLRPQTLDSGQLAMYAATEGSQSAASRLSGADHL